MGCGASSAEKYKEETPEEESKPSPKEVKVKERTATEDNRPKHQALTCSYEDCNEDVLHDMWKLVSGEVEVVHLPPTNTPRRQVVVTTDYGDVKLMVSNSEVRDASRDVMINTKTPDEVVDCALDLSMLDPPRLLLSRTRRCRFDHFKLRTLPGHARAVKAIALSMDKRMLISGDGIIGGPDDKNGLRCLDTRVEKQVGVLDGRRVNCHEPASDIAIALNGQIAVSCDKSDTLLLWDMNTFRTKRAIQLWVDGGTELRLSSVKFSPDGKLIGAAAEECDDDGQLTGCIGVWEVLTGNQLFLFREHVGPALCLDFSHDSSAVLSGARDSSLLLWNAYTEEIIQQFVGHTGAVFSCSLSCDCSTALSADEKSICIWATATGSPLISRHIDVPGTHPLAAPSTLHVPSLSRHRQTASTMFGPDYVVLATTERQVFVLEKETLKEVISFRTRAPVTCLSSSRTAIALGDFWGNVYLLEAQLV